MEVQSRPLAFIRRIDSRISFGEYTTKKPAICRLFLLCLHRGNFLFFVALLLRKNYFWEKFSGSFLGSLLGHFLGSFFERFLGNFSGGAHPLAATDNSGVGFLATLNICIDGVFGSDQKAGNQEGAGGEHRNQEAGIVLPQYG